MDGEWTMPSRKWMAARVTMIAATLVAWIQAGEWNTTIAVMVVGVMSEAAISYLVPNASSDE